MDIRWLSTILALAAALGCGGDPADVAGTYTVAVTNGDNGCMFQEWTVGDSITGISVVITQDGSEATATVEGLIGAFLALALGSNEFSGDVDGSSLELTLLGTVPANQGNCTYTTNSTMTAELDGDVLQGQIAYEFATNENPDCFALERCVTLQNFNGTRPPSP